MVGLHRTNLFDQLSHMQKTNILRIKYRVALLVWDRGYLLCCCTMQSGKSLQTFQRFLPQRQ
jgi:hypothetical protein